MTKDLSKEVIHRVKKYLKNYTPPSTKTSERTGYSLREIALYCNVSYYSVWCIWKGRRKERAKRIKKEYVFPQYNPSGKYFNVDFFSNWLTGEKEWKTKAA